MMSLMHLEQTHCLLLQYIGWYHPHSLQYQNCQGSKKDHTDVY